MSVRLIHAADLHLGSPLRGLENASTEVAQRLARATEASLERIVQTAIDEAVDFVVIAGDVYDQAARSVRANQFLAEQFGRLDEREIPVYLIHGNHDPVGRGAEQLDLPPNVHVFGTDAVESVAYPDPDDPMAEVLGRSYRARHEGENYVDAYRSEYAGVPTIGLLHSGLNPDGREYVPCRLDDLDAQDVDYWALGHLHQPQRLDGVPGGYPGIPQPRHPGEPAVGGAFLVDLAVDKDPDIEFVPTASILWQSVDIDISTLDTDEDTSIANLTDLETHLIERSRDLQDRDPVTFVEHDIPIATDEWSVEGIVSRWTLAGRGEVNDVLAAADAGPSFLAEQIREQLIDDDPFVWIETVRDRTAPPLPDRATLVAEDTVIAEFVELVEELRADAEYRETLREEAGDAWQYIDDPDREDVRENRVGMTDERLDALIDAATEIAITRLAGGR